MSCQIEGALPTEQNRSGKHHTDAVRGSQDSGGHQIERSVGEEKGVIVSWIDEQTGELIFSDYVEEDPKHTAIRAITRYKRIKQANGLSLMEFDPREDRNNKIRIQMAHKGYPVLGDKMHGEYKSPIRRLALHAFLLRFRHPVTRELMKFELPYPKDFRSLVTKINPTKE